MLKNYFKTAWRNILKNKFYAALNIIGLTVGLTVGLLILLWVNDELSFDQFHNNSANLYRVKAQIGSGTSRQVWDGVQAPIAFYAKKEVAGIEEAVRLISSNDYSFYSYQDKQFKPDPRGTYCVDPSFFKLFNFKLLKGDARNPLPNKTSVVLTQKAAERFFGSEDPMGKIIKGNNKDNFTVTGIIADAPGNSSIQFDMLASIENISSAYDGKGFWKSMDSDWGNYYVETYLQIQPGVSPQTVVDRLARIHNKYQPPQSGSDGVRYLPQLIGKMHLYSADGNPTAMQTVRVFLVVAVLILLIACINYVNLSTARAMLRSKEVSVRKIIGAERFQLFMQFIVETTLFFGVALLFSFGLISMLMPVYNAVAGKEMAFDLTNASIWKVIGLTIVVTLLASSIYPAMLLSSFKPINALKGKLTMGMGNAAFRKVLVVCQFIFSIGLIIGTLIINNQLKYIREKELGYDKAHVFTFAARKMADNYEGVKAELLQQPGIADVASGNGKIVNIGNTTGDTDWDGKENGRSFLIHPLAVDKSYIKFFKLQLVAGQGFTGVKTDSAHYILNETAVREAGITNPIGKRFKLHEQNGTIIGVVKDFHFASFKQKIEPAIFSYQPSNWMIFVRTTAKDAPKAIAAVQRLNKKYNPDYPFDYAFLDDSFNKMYKADERQGTLFSWFTGIAIMISCLGLFGLATYTAQVKVKEIGIRKVLGASVGNITAMLSKDFIVLVFIALVIASPVAWYLMNHWLQDFVYRANISWWVFLVAGLSAIAISFLTISFQAIKAALANPVKSLRSE